MRNCANLLIRTLLGWCLIITGFFITSSLIGCNQLDISSYHEANLKRHKDYNINSLSQGGEEVGVLPDGRKIIRYSVLLPSTSHDASQHYIYVVDGSVTLNRRVSVGKYSHNEVTVLLDGGTE